MRSFQIQPCAVRSVVHVRRAPSEDIGQENWQFFCKRDTLRETEEVVHGNIVKFCEPFKGEPAGGNRAEIKFISRVGMGEYKQSARKFPAASRQASAEELSRGAESQGERGGVDASSDRRACKVAGAGDDRGSLRKSRQRGGFRRDFAAESGGGQNVGQFACVKLQLVQQGNRTIVSTPAPLREFPKHRKDRLRNFPSGGRRCSPCFAEI